MERVHRMRTFMHLIHNPEYKHGKPHHAVRAALNFADALGDDLREYAGKVGRGRDWLEKHPDHPEYRERWERWAGWWNTYVACRKVLEEWAECPKPEWEEEG